MTDREIIQNYLTPLQKTQGEPTAALFEARSRFQMIYTRDYAEQTGRFWIRNHADEVAPLMEKQPRQMTLHEVRVCLTNIVARDRIYGSIGGCEKSGLMAKLLERFLELMEEEDA